MIDPKEELIVRQPESFMKRARAIRFHRSFGVEMVVPIGATSTATVYLDSVLVNGFITSYPLLIA